MYDDATWCAQNKVAVNSKIQKALHVPEIHSFQWVVTWCRVDNKFEWILFLAKPTLLGSYVAPR
jgi:hypothetical protein